MDPSSDSIEVKMEEDYSSDSDATYSIDGDTQDPPIVIALSSGASSSSDDDVAEEVEMLYEEKIVSEYQRLILAYMSERQTRQRASNAELLAWSLYSELLKMHRHNWHNRKGKLASLKESVLDLVGLAQRSLKSLPGPFPLEWLETFDPSSLEFVKGDKLKIVLEEAFDLEKHIVVDSHNLEPICRVVIYFLRRAYRKVYGEKSEEALVEDLYKIAKDYKFEENVAGGDDGIFDNPRYLHRLALEISEYNYLRANGCELEESILNLKTWIIMFSSMCTEYEDLKWLHQWHSKDASELQLHGCLDEIIGDALEHACAKDKTDDMLKKRCRLLVRFFRTVQISEEDEDEYS